MEEDEQAMIEIALAESIRSKEEEDLLREEYAASSRALRLQQDLEYAQSLSEDQQKSQIKDFQQFLDEETEKEDPYDFDYVQENKEEEKEEKEEEKTIENLRNARLKFFCGKK
jgi:hypothetical protein